MRGRLAAFAVGRPLRARLGGLALLLAAVAAGCSNTDTSTPVPDDGEPPFGGRPVADYFRSNCSSCHGTDRQGGIGPALLPDALTEDDAFYFDTIAQGRGSMPAWRRSGLTDREITALIEFLRSEP